MTAVALAALLPLVACSGERGKSASDGGPGSSDAAGPPSPDGPKLLSFDASVSRLTEGGQVTFTALVTDPQGIGDLIGGKLDGAGDTTYGAFATSADEGAYQLTLTWPQLHQIAAIDFAFGQEDVRMFTAVFFDQAGHSASGSLSVALHCDGAAACDAVCVDTQNDPTNCGNCGTQCGDASGTNFACGTGRCAAWSACITGADVPISDPTCEGYCNFQGKGCAVGCPDETGTLRALVGHASTGTCAGTESAGPGCSANLSTAGFGLECCCQ